MLPLPQGAKQADRRSELARQLNLSRRGDQLAIGGPRRRLERKSEVAPEAEALLATRGGR